MFLFLISSPESPHPAMPNEAADMNKWAQKRLCSILWWLDLHPITIFRERAEAELPWAIHFGKLIFIYPKGLLYVDKLSIHKDRKLFLNELLGGKQHAFPPIWYSFLCIFQRGIVGVSHIFFFDSSFYACLISGYGRPPFCLNDSSHFISRPNIQKACANKHAQHGHNSVWVSVCTARRAQVCKRAQLLG